jgi:hypothetical protein
MKFRLFSAKIMYLLKVFLSNKIQMLILIYKVLKAIKKFSLRIIMIIINNNINHLLFDIIIKLYIYFNYYLLYYNLILLL